MATDHFEEDIELDDEIVEDDDLEINVLDDEVDYDGDTDFVEPGDEEDIDEEDVAEGEGEEEEEEEEEEGEEEDEEVADDLVDDDDDVVVDDEEEEEEDEETLEVLLGPDSDTAVSTSRSRSDDSGDAPPGEGEFTCRSCFLVKRRAQLADAEEMICLDCA
jgi:hypothetical protein